MNPKKIRLDQLLVDRGLAPSRSSAQGVILAGWVTLDGRTVDKCGFPTTPSADVVVKQRPRFVSRGGDKLAHAIAYFDVPIGGTQALDVGASTGGFVDCLLQADAAHVIALDVGRGQIDMRLRRDARVTVIEGVNARYLDPGSLPYRANLLTMDVSFISVTKVLPAVVRCMASTFHGLILVKPQFEAGPQLVGKGGVVREPKVWTDVLTHVTVFIREELTLSIRGVVDSGLPGTDGNHEFFVWISAGGEAGLLPANLASEIKLVTGVVVDPEES